MALCGQVQQIVSSRVRSKHCCPNIEPAGSNSRRWSQTATASASTGSCTESSDCECSHCAMTLLCHCGLEAKIVEHHDNYRRTYACCPKRDEIACAYFHEVDPPYPQKAMDVIDDLVMENRELRDALIEEQNTHYWMHEEDTEADAAVRDTVAGMQNMLGVAAAVIIILLAIVASLWMR